MKNTKPFKSHNYQETISFQVGTTFEEFKEKFYTRFPDLKIFNIDNINLTKVILDGLKVNYIAKKIKNNFIFQPIILILLKFLYWKLSYAFYKRKFSFKLQKKFLIIDEGKLSEKADGRKVSYYTENITQNLNKDEYFTISLIDDKKIKSILNAISYSDIIRTSFATFPSIDVFKFIFKLRKFYRKIKVQNVFSDTDLQNIQIALNTFFFQYYAYLKFFEKCKFQKVIFTQHYHNEGFILACKRNKIHIIELQHGLISTKDIFYVFPKNFEEIRSRALMPDEIWCFGEYWKEILSKGYEWEPSQIKVFGNYVYRSNTVPSTIPTEFLNKNYILITTQTFLHSYYMEYVKKLSQYLNTHNIDIKILVKIHPAEKIETYQEIAQLPSVLVFDSHLDYWLKNCQYHITIYSTTVFDAVLHDKLSYCLYYDAFKDYLEEYATLNFVRIIDPEDFSFIHQYSASSYSNINKKYYYNDIDYNLLNS